MIISCPECGFSRTVPDSSIPSTAELATCPKCEARFRFRSVVPKEERLTPSGEQPSAASAKRKNMWDTVSSLHQQWEEEKQLKKEARTKKTDVDAYHEPDNFTTTDMPDADAAANAPDTVKGAPTVDESDFSDFLEAMHSTDVSPLDGEPEANKAEQGQNDLADAEEKFDTLPPTGFPDADVYHKKDPELNYRKVAEEKEALTISKSEPWLSFIDAVHPIPWEYPERYGYLSGLYQTILRILLATPRFFATMPAQGSLRPALLFYVILGVFEYLLNNIWLYSYLRVASVEPEKVNEMFFGAEQIQMYMLSPLKYIFLFFMLSWVFQMMLQLVVPERAQFGRTARVLAYSTAPAVLSIVPFLGIIVSLVWSVACLLIGMRYAYHLSWKKTCLAILPVYGFILLLMISFLRSMFGPGAQILGAG